jgi:hypothetical protein
MQSGRMWSFGGTVMRSICMLAAVLGLSAMLAAAPATQPTTQPALVSGKGEERGEKKAWDFVVTGDAEKTIVDIGKVGIGQGTVTRTGNHWPKTLVIRVPLVGMENLNIAQGDVSLHVSVGPGNSFEPLQYIRTRGKEDGPKLDNKSPYWAEVRRYNKQGKPTELTPDLNGWYEVTIPAILLDEKSKELRLSWIDFYRR